MALKAGLVPANVVAALNKMTPTARDAALGDILVDIITAHNDLQAKFTAFLTRMDTANLTGMGTANVTTHAPLAATVKAVGTR